jgi:hypothetical protein
MFFYSIIVIIRENEISSLAPAVKVQPENKVQKGLEQ